MLTQPYGLTQHFPALKNSINQLLYNIDHQITMDRKLKLYFKAMIV